MPEDLEVMYSEMRFSEIELSDLEFSESGLSEIRFSEAGFSEIDGFVSADEAVEISLGVG